MVDKPRKRQRIQKANPFLDIEAAADEDSIEEDEHDDEDNDEGEDQLSDNESSVGHARLRDLHEGLDDTELWDAFYRNVIDRYGNLARADDNHGDDEGTVMWELGCAVGYEQIAVQNIQRGLPDCIVHSHPLIPGRVWAEASCFEIAEALAKTIPELQRWVRSVPRRNFSRLALIRTSPISTHTWARVGGTPKCWKRYRGDVGLVRRLDSELVLLLVPRIPTEGCKTPPRQMLVGPSHQQGRRERFTEQGFLIVDLTHIHLIYGSEITPSFTEFQLFQSHDMLEPAFSKKTENALLDNRINPGDRVKIIGGDYRNVLGFVKEVCEHEYVVHLPSQGLDESFQRRLLRAAFRPGDEVKVVDGPDTGLTGWVVDVFDDGVKLMNLQKGIQVNAPNMALEFYTPESIKTTLRPRNPGKFKCGKNPNAVYIGKRVIAVGTGNPWKGYKGRIKDTDLFGNAWVELDARQQETQLIKIDKLAILSNDETASSQIVSIAILSDDSSTQIVTAGTLKLPVQPLFMQASLSAPPCTPLPTPSSSIDLSPAWDPSSRTPLLLSSAWGSSSQTTSLTPAYLPQDNHWLEDVALQNLRFKVRCLLDGPEGRVLEVRSVKVGSCVEVRDMMKIRYLALDSLEAVRPTDLNDLVTPISGNMKGRKFKVKGIEDGKYQVRVSGERARKSSPDPKFNRSDLVQIFP